jgi:hypothetical protein
MPSLAMACKIARLGVEGKLRAAAEAPCVSVQTVELPRWKVAASSGAPGFGFAADARGSPEPVGGASSCASSRVATSTASENAAACGTVARPTGT